MPEQKCAGRVPDHTGFHLRPCSRRGSLLEKDGAEFPAKWWCKTHAPSTVAKKRAKKDADYKVYSKACDVRQGLLIKAEKIVPPIAGEEYEETLVRFVVSLEEKGVI